MGKKSATGGKGYQSIDEQIVALEKEIEELRAKQRELQNPKQEYPKFIMDPSNPSRGRIVNNAEEEAASKKGAGELVPVSDEFTTREELVEDVDAEAGGAHGNKKKITTRTSTYRTAPGTGRTDSGAKPKDAKSASKTAKPVAAPKPGLLARAKGKLTGKGPK